MEKMEKKLLEKKKDKMKHNESLEIIEIARFAKASLDEIQRLSVSYQIDEVIFELNVKGNQVKFTVKPKHN